METISQLWSVTCHMGSHSVTCHPTQVNTPRLTPTRQSGTVPTPERRRDSSFNLISCRGNFKSDEIKLFLIFTTLLQSCLSSHLNCISDLLLLNTFNHPHIYCILFCDNFLQFHNSFKHYDPSVLCAVYWETNR